METSNTFSSSDTLSAPSAHKKSKWLWWVIGILIIIAVSAGVVFFIGKNKVSIPPGLVEKRKDLAKVFEQISGVQDVDIRPLLDMESKKDYKGAVELMTQALQRNAEYEKLNASLVSVSDELNQLSTGVKPSDLGAKATSAFSDLVKLVQAEKKFYEDRRTLYELTKSYYTDLEAKKNPSIPAELQAVVQAVNADLASARDLSQKFTASVKAFDDAASMK